MFRRLWFSGALAGLSLCWLLFAVGPTVAAQEAVGAGHDFAGDYPASCSPEDARAVYKQVLRNLRTEHRAALQQIVDAIARDLDDGQSTDAARDETPATRDAARQWLSALRTATEAQTAVSLTLQFRSRLSPYWRQRAQAVVDELSGLLIQIQQAKLAYQPHLADELRARWHSRDLRQKRELLVQYYALSGLVPEWLLRRGAKVSISPASPANSELELFQRRATDQLHDAETAFEPLREALLVKTQRALAADETTSTQRRALESVQRLLLADYGKGFRAMMLLQPEAALPDEVREQVANVCEEFQEQLERLRADRTSQLAQLEQSLEPLRQSQLKKAEFAELFAIECRLRELQQIVRPLRIRARRAPDIDRAEEASLVDRRGSHYQVRFLRDDHESWLPGDQVLLSPGPATIRDELAVRAPTTGPGKALTEGSSLKEGQTLMAYRNQKWHPVEVVDVSPFGAVIRWQGYYQESDQVEPLSQLRTLDDR